MSNGAEDGPGRKSAQKIRTNLNSSAIPLTGNRIDSVDLFAGSREILISHGEDIYRLRLTAQNKLILTK